MPTVAADGPAMKLPQLAKLVLLFPFLAPTLAATGCVPPPAAPLEVGKDGTLSQGTLSQGTLSQGTLSQGTLSQGTLSQGSQNAVWGFSTSGWQNNGWSLKNAGVDKGMLTAEWDNNGGCFIGRGAPSDGTRECGWVAGGGASCAAGETVRVGAGGCSIGSASRAAFLRVCAGDQPCRSTEAIASSDHAATTGKLCSSGAELPSVMFTCPAAGHFFTMVSPKELLGDNFTATVATIPARPFDKHVSSADFVNTTLSGVHYGADGTIVSESYVIKEITPAVDDPTGNTNFYDLRLTSDQTTSLCLGPNPRAIPLRGHWDAGSFWRKSDSSHITFACPQGVIAKCYMRMGYRPWDKTRENVALEDYFQTCTRAARADYCGDGRSYTVDNTLIDLWDKANYQQETTPPITSLAIEGVWVRDTYPAPNDEFAAPQHTACLAKKRWDTLPFDGPCVTLTPDPRTNTDDIDPPFYCDDKPITGSSDSWFARSDVLEINKSAYVDAGLWRWTRTSGNERRVTTRLTTTSPNGQPGYRWNPTGEPADPVFLGAVYSANHRSDGVRPGYAIPVCSFDSQIDSRLMLCQVDAEEHVLTPPPGPGYALGVLEGYIDAPGCEDAMPACPTNKPLRSYHIGADYFVNVDGVPLPLGALGGELLGYLPR